MLVPMCWNGIHSVARNARGTENLIKFHAAVVHFISALRVYVFIYKSSLQVKLFPGKSLFFCSLFAFLWMFLMFVFWESLVDITAQWLVHTNRKFMKRQSWALPFLPNSRYSAKLKKREKKGKTKIKRKRVVNWSVIHANWCFFKHIKDYMIRYWFDVSLERSDCRIIELCCMFKHVCLTCMSIIVE